MSQNLNFPVPSGEQSVTNWINALKGGDHLAAERLWSFLQRRLVNHAQRLVRVSPAHYDEDDVALSAFGAMCDGLQNGRYEDIDNRSDLWKLLAVITVNKARKRAEHENRLKRGGAFSKISDGESILKLLTSNDLPPELSLSMKEECERKLESLEQKELKLVVLLKVEGYTNDEIADSMGCTRRSIQRRLAVIREIWTQVGIESC